MRNNSNKNNNKTTARIPAARQGAAANTSLAQRREKAAVRLPEERRKGTKYQVIRGQYLNKETTDNIKVAEIKNIASKQEKSKRQTAAANTVKNENEKVKTSSSSEKNISYEKNDKNADNETNGQNEAKEKYAKSEKAVAFTERLQANIELGKVTSNSASAVQGESIPLQGSAVNYNETGLNEAVYIPPNVTWDKVLDNAAQKDSVYSQGGSAAERAASYKEKADFYLKKMKKNTETGKKEVNPNQDKDIGALYKKAYKLAHKEELVGKKTDTLFDKAQSAILLKSEVDNALNKEDTGEAVVAAAAIPLTHAATKAVRKLADKNKAVNTGKAGFELAAKVTADVVAADGVGEATANAVAAVPKYVVEKKVEKTVRQVMQNQHDRKIAAQKERLREQQEKVEKRAQQMKKENMQRNMKVDLYKSEHGMGGKGNALQRMKSAIKNTIESMKRAASFIKSSGMMLMAAAGGTLIPIFAVILVVIIVVLFVVFPFFYISKDGKEDEIEDSTFGETVQHYYAVMDKVVDDFNAEIEKFLKSGSEYDNTGVENPEKKAQYEADCAEYHIQYDSYLADYDNYCATYPDNFGAAPEMPEKDYWYTAEELNSLGMKRGPIFEGFVESDESDASRVPKRMLYDEMLCTISTFNAKLMTRPDTYEAEDDENTEAENTESNQSPETEGNESSSGGSGDIIFMTDETVAGAYSGTEFWDFSYWEEGVVCPSGGDCCSLTVQVAHYDDEGNFLGYSEEEETYCPGHYIIKWKIELDFDLDKVWEAYQFDDEDEKNYKDTKKQFDKEKTKAGIP